MKKTDKMRNSPKKIYGSIFCVLSLQIIACSNAVETADRANYPHLLTEAQLAETKAIPLPPEEVAQINDELATDRERLDARRAQSTQGVISEAERARLLQKARKIRAQKPVLTNAERNRLQNAVKAHQNRKRL